MIERKLYLPVRKHEGDLDAVRAEFLRFAQAGALPATVERTMNIVLDELISNVMKYGYDDDGEHSMEISFRAGEDAVELELVDDGRAFNILEAQSPDVALGVSDRPIGGLGIHMVRRMTDEQLYERRDGRNWNTIRKRFDRRVER